MKLYTPPIAAPLAYWVSWTLPPALVVSPRLCCSPPWALFSGPGSFCSPYPGTDIFAPTYGERLLMNSCQTQLSSLLCAAKLTGQALIIMRQWNTPYFRQEYCLVTVGVEMKSRDSLILKGAKRSNQYLNLLGQQIAQKP